MSSPTPLDVTPNPLRSVAIRLRSQQVLALRALESQIEDAIELGRAQDAERLEGARLRIAASARELDTYLRETEISRSNEAP